VVQKVLRLYGVPEEQSAALQQLYTDMEKLRVERNYIVHGETWDGAFKGTPRQPYRIGVIKENLEYSDDFEHSKHGKRLGSHYRSGRVITIMSKVPVPASD
jgi:hypothetical protein